MSNVANFGAFVDIGVHQDGLVHISMLAHQFVKDPRDVVKAGDIVRVKVMEVDIPRQRISLSMRMDDEPGATTQARAGDSDRQGKAQGDRAKNTGQGRGQSAGAGAQPAAGGTFANLFANAKDLKKR